MNTFIKGVLPVVAAALAFPAASFAQSSDAAYCRALVAKYEAYLDQNPRLGASPQGLEQRSESRSARRVTPPAFRRSRRRSRTPSSTCRRAIKSPDFIDE
jgi:hypothetical protein